MSKHMLLNDDDEQAATRDLVSMSKSRRFLRLCGVHVLSNRLAGSLQLVYTGGEGCQIYISITTNNGSLGRVCVQEGFEKQLQQKVVDKWVYFR